MKRFFLLSMFFLMAPCLSIDLQVLTTKNKELVENVFGKNGLAFSISEQKKIEQLFNDIDALTPNQKIVVIEILIPLLQNQIKENLALRKDRIVNHIIRHQIQHLDEYKKRLITTLTFFQRLELNFERLFQKLNCYFKKSEAADKECWELALADRIFDYYTFERESILLNYNTLLRYIVALKNNHLPELVYFWSHAKRELYADIIHQVRALTPEVKVQFLSELFMLALQSFLMGGNGMYINWLDKEQEQLFEKYQKKQSEIEANFEAYVNRLNAIKNNVVQQIFDGFKTGLQKIVDERKNADDALAQEQIYLFKSINLSYPTIHLLNWPPIPYDQMFEASVMNTPKSHPWYNIYQQGDWEFDAQTNSFFQNELVPFGTPFWLSDFKTLKKPGDTTQEFITDPSRNSIFTEYISNQASYPISIECTILNCTYPFFVGILFNRARWISADPERLWQYRLVGFYGTQAKPDDPSTREIRLAFAQEEITFTKDNKEQIISPLEKITTNLSDERIILASLPKADIGLLAKDSITFVFDITTAPESVSFTVSKKGQTPLISQKTINNLYSTIALYGGIGFMSAGAQAEFKIIKPEKLIFSANELKGEQ